MSEHYQPIDARVSPRFAGIRTFMRLPHNQDAEHADFAFVGIPFDTATTFRPGARFGPVAIREMSTLLKPYNQVLDIDVFEHCSGIDWGDVDVISGYIEDTYTAIEEAFKPIAEAGAVPIGLGGDHSITLAELRAIAAVYGPVALVHFDAHTDTGDLYFGKLYNHGTPFRRAVEEGLIVPEASTQFGIRGTLYSRDDIAAAERLGLRSIPAHKVRQMGFEALLEEIRGRAGDRPTFISFDLDFVDPSCAPGTGTPEVAGFTSLETMELIRGLEGINLVGADVVEMLPAMDAGQITAALAASVAFEFASLVACRKAAAAGRT